MYFYSANDVGGIYGYTGEAPTHLSANLTPAFEELTSFENVFVSWAGRRLWISTPWVKDSVLERAPTAPVATTKNRGTRRVTGRPRCGRRPCSLPTPTSVTARGRCTGPRTGPSPR